MRARHLAAALVVVVAAARPAPAATWTQTGTGPFSWTTAGNWSGGVPNAAGAVADLSTVSNGDQTISLDAQITVGTLTLGSTTGSYTLTNGFGGGLTFGGGTGLTVTAGNTRGQTINADVLVAGTFNVTNNSSATLTLGGPVTVSAGTQSMNVLGAGNTVVNGVIGGSLNLTKGSTGSDTGTLTLGATNVYTGSTSIAVGTLKLGADNAIPVGTTLNMSGTAIFDLNGFSQTLGSLSIGTTNRVISSTAGGVLVSTSGATWQSPLGDGTHDNFTVVLNSQSSTFFTLNSGTASTFSGGFWVALGNATDTSTSTVNQFGNGTATILAGSSLNVQKAASISGLTGITVRAGGQLQLFGLGTVTLPAMSVGGLGNVNGALYTQNSTTPTTVSAASGNLTLTADTSIGFGLLTLNNQIVGGSNQLYRTSTQTLTLANDANTLGNVFVTSGAVQVGSNNALGTASKAAAGGGTYLSQGGFLIAASAAGSPSIGEAITIYGLTSATSGGSLQAAAANQVFSGSVNLAYALFGGAATVAPASGTGFTISGPISGAGTFVKEGAGIVTLSGSNTYLGGTQVNAGTLVLGGPAALSSVGDLTMSGTATLDLNGNSVTIRSLAPTAGAIIKNGGAGAATFTTQPNSNSRIVALFQDGAGTLGLTKLGGSVNFMLESPSANTYTGATTAGSGSFQVAFRSVSGTPFTTDMINPASPLVLAGGTLEVTSDSGLGSMTGTALSQTFNAATAAAGQSSVRATPPTSGTATLVMTAISHNAGGTLNFDTTVGTIGTSTATVGGILGGWATANSNNWATVSGSTVVSLNQTVDAAFAAGANVNLQNSDLTGTGPLTINALRINSNRTATLSGTITVDTGGVLVPGGGTIKGGTLASGTSGELIFNVVSGTTTTVGISGTPTVVAGGSLTVSGNGTLDLTNAGGSTYAGPVYVVNSTGTGNLQIGSDGSLGAVPGSPVPNAITLVGTGGQAIDTSGGAFIKLATSFSGSISSNRGITIAGLEGGIDTNGVSTTYGGVITGGGGFVKAGTSTLTLSGANTYLGATNVRSGTLKLGADNALPATTALTVGSGNTFDLNGHAQTLTGLTGSGSVTNGGGTTTLTLNVSGLDPNTTGNYTFSGQIGASGQANFGLVKSGSGTQLLNGTTSLYSGGTTIIGGTLKVSSDGALGATSGGITLNGGALSAGSGFTLSSTRAITVGPAGGSGSGTIDVSSGTLVYNGTIADAAGGTGTLVITGFTTLQLGGTSTYSGNTEVRGGVLQLGTDNALPAGTTVIVGNPFTSGASGSAVVDLNGHNLTIAGLHNNGLDRNSNRLVNTSVTAATLTLNVPTGVTTTLDTQLSNNGTSANFSLAKDGAGTLIVAGTFAGGPPPTSSVRYSGNTNVLNGTLQLGGGAVDILPNTTTVTLGSGTNSGVLDLAGQRQTLAGLTTGGSGTANRVVNSVTVVPATLTLNVAGTNIFAGNLGAAGQNNFTLTKTGAGTLILTGSNTYTGQTTVIASGGTLQIGNGGTSGTLGSGPVSLAGGTTLAFNRSDAYSAANTIFGAGAVTVQGGGTLTLTGTSLYTGGTTVIAGALAVNNAAGSATGSGTVTIQTGATLQGTGRALGPVTVQGNGHLAPGNSIGTITTGAATFNNLGVYNVEFGGLTDDATTRDRLVSTGVINFVTGSIVQVQLVGADPGYQTFTTYSYTIATGASPIQVDGSSGNPLSGITLNASGYAGPANFSLARSGNNLVLNFTPVPEPASAVAVLLAGLAGAAAWRRRRGVVATTRTAG